MELMRIQYVLENHFIRIEHFFFFYNGLWSLFFLTNMIGFLSICGIVKNDTKNAINR